MNCYETIDLMDLALEGALPRASRPGFDEHLGECGPCRNYYDQRRTAGDLHHQALRALGNRLVGILHGCLAHHALYDEHTAWGHRSTLAA